MQLAEFLNVFKSKMQVHLFHNRYFIIIYIILEICLQCIAECIDKHFKIN